MDKLTFSKFRKNSKDLFAILKGCLFFLVVGLILSAVVGVVIKLLLNAFSYGWKLL